MRWMVLLLLSVAVGWCGDEERPACTAKNRGQLWPPEANTNREVAREAARCGELLICTRGVLRHGWKPLAVHISQLVNGPKAAIPGCAAAPVVNAQVSAGDAEERSQSAANRVAAPAAAAPEK